MAYPGIDWRNKPDQRSPLNATNLEIMDTELVYLDKNDSTLQSALEKSIDYDVIELSDGYIENSGSTIDINTVIISGSWEHGVIECEEGDRFIVNCKSTTAARGYSFSKSDGTKIYAAPANTIFENEEIVAPADSAYLVVQANGTGDKTCYKFRRVADEIDVLESEIVDKVDEITEEITIPAGSGYIDCRPSTLDLDNPTISGKWRHVVVSCQEGDYFTLNCNSTTIPRGYCFLDSNNKRLVTASANTTFTNLTVVTPEGASKLLIQTNKDDFKSYKGMTVEKSISLLLENMNPAEKEYTTEENTLLKSIMDDKDENTETFCVITDSHYALGSDQRVASLKQASLVSEFAQKAGAKFVVHLGDIIEGGESTHSANSTRFGKYMSEYHKGNIPLLYTIAHHEMYGVQLASGWGNDPTALTPGECEGMYGFPTKWINPTYSSDKTSWYVDLDGIRYIGLNSVSNTTRGFSDAVISFLESALQNTELPVIVFAHVPAHESVDWNNGSVQNRAEINTLLNGYSGDVLAYIHGHTHWDNMYKFDGYNYPFISVCSSLPIKMDVETYGCRYGTPIAYDRTLDTWTEFCFDIVNVHKDTGVLNFFRYGAGVDRTYNPNA